jgi:hypothetical protein
MKALVDRKLTVVIPTVAILTVITGLWLYDRASLHFQSAYLRSGPGATFGLGGLFAILTLIIGGAVLAPAIDNSIKYAQLGAAASGSEKETLMAKAQAARVTVGKASQLVALTGTLAAAAMAMARYM